MKTFGITGGTAADKIDLLERLVPAFSAQSVSVSTAKFMNHPFDVDRPGKDSHSHRQAGATEVVVLSNRRWALMHENRGETDDDLDGLLARMTPVDLVIAVGFREPSLSKLEIARAGDAHPLRCLNDPSIVGLAVDAPIDPSRLPNPPPPQLALDDAGAIVDLILDRCGLRPPEPSARTAIRKSV